MWLLGLLVIFYAVTFNYSGNIALSPMLLPGVTGIAIVVLSASEIIKIIKNKKFNSKIINTDFKKYKKSAMVIAMLFAYLVLMQTVGFIISTIILTALLLLFFGEKRLTAVVASVAITISLYTIFEVMLNIGLP